MRRLLLLSALLLCATTTHAQRTLVQCGTLLDPAVSMQPMAEKTVVVEGGAVAAVNDGYTTGGAGDTVIDLRDAYCMPGLMDMHTHLTGESRRGGAYDGLLISAPEQALRATRYAERTLMAGFTTVRNVGAGEGVDFALKRAIQQGYVVGPRMFVSGGSLAIMGGHGDPTNGVREDIIGVPDYTMGVVDGVPSAIRGTRLAIKRGADLIKITATAGVLSLAGEGSAPQFREDEIRAIVETARDQGRKVTAHAHGDEGIQRAVRAGVGSIEHGTYLSEASMALMRERGAYLVPTITAGKSVADSARIAGYYVPVVAAKAREIGPLIQDTFARAYRAGVPIAFGTDAGVFAHGRNAVEFAYMVEAGMPPMEAIRTATVHAADLLGQTGRLGSLQPGHLADLVAVPANPLADITALQNVSFVMKDGIVYKHDDM